MPRGFPLITDFNSDQNGVVTTLTAVEPSLHSHPKSSRVLRVIAWIVLANLTVSGFMVGLLPGGGPFGFVLSSLFGCLMILSWSYRPNHSAITQLDEGLWLPEKTGGRLIAWDQIRHARVRPFFRVVELDCGSEFIRFAYSVSNAQNLIETIMREVANAHPLPARSIFQNSARAHVLGAVALMAVPLSIVRYDGIVLLAWGIALWGLVLLLFIPRGVVLSPSLLEVYRLIGRRPIALRSIKATRLQFRAGWPRGGLAITILLRNGAVEQLDLDAGHLLMMYATLRRALQTREEAGVAA